MRRASGRAMVVGLMILASCVGTIGDEPVPTGAASGALCADTPFARRLTIGEYVETVQAVLGIELRQEAEERLPPDLRADGFSNTAGSLIVTLDHAAGYDELASLVLEGLGDLGTLADEHTSCTEMSEACQRELVKSLGAKLYRGPLDDAEVAPLLSLFEAAAAEGEGFEGGVALVLRSMLQSPRFLYRLERETGSGEARDLDGWEMASRLSYFVWGGPPDEALREAASRDELRSDEQIEAQVRRMLDDPRARAISLRYLSDWLALDRLDNLSRDPARFPDWDPALGQAMKAETRDYFEQLVWEEEAPLSRLFDAQYTIVSAPLAAHYGIGEPDAEGRVDLSGVPERQGILTQGSIATVGGNTASMVSRGLFLLESVLCSHIASPPPGVDTTPPELEAGSSQRTYSEDRVMNNACGGCHSQFEPLAWGLERYDPTGAYVLEDQFGNALEQDGQVKIPQGETIDYQTTAELSAILAESEQVNVCMAEKSAQFAMGRPLGKAESCSLTKIDEDFLASQGTYQDLLVAITLSPMFRRIQTEVSP